MPGRSPKERAVHAFSSGIGLAAFNIFDEGVVHHRNIWSASTLVVLVSMGLGCGLVLLIITTILALQPNERIEIEGNTISKFAGGKKAKRTFKSSEIRELRAEPRRLGYRRLIYLENYDIVAYDWYFEDVYDLDRRLMDLTGRSFTSLQTGQTIDLVKASEEFLRKQKPKSQRNAISKL